MARCASKRPASTAACAAFAALMAGVTLNALVFQSERHPAPLFDAAAAPEAAPAAGGSQAATTGEQLDRAPTGTLPAGADAAPPTAAASPPDAAPQPADDPGARDADVAPRPASKKHDRPSHQDRKTSDRKASDKKASDKKTSEKTTSAKKAKGHDKISQFLDTHSKKDPSESRHRPRSKKDD